MLTNDPPDRPDEKYNTRLVDNELSEQTQLLCYHIANQLHHLLGASTGK